MADVKIKLIVDDSGALSVLKEFNATFQAISATQKGLNNQFTRTFANVKKQAAKARDNFKQLGIVARNGMQRASKATKAATRDVSLLGKAGKQIRNVFAGVFIADTLRASINALKNAVVNSIKTFADFEDGLIGVGKTVNILGPELDNLGEDIRNLNVPVSNKDLLQLAKTAGQLGVRGSKNILKFTETMARLESATDVAGEQGASAIARILNVTGEAVENVDRFGSILVALGNNSEATESEILHMTNEVARATGHFGVSAQEALAFGAAMKSLGIRAEGGGTAVGKVFKLLDRAVSEQSPKLEKFAKVIGITGEELTRAFREDKTKAVLSVIEGLGKNTEKLNTNLSALGLNSERTSKVIAPMAQRFKVLSESFGLASDESKKNTALTEESNRAFESLSSTWGLLTKQISSAATEIVEKFAPEMKELIKLTADYIKIFRGVDEGKTIFSGLSFSSNKTKEQFQKDKDSIEQNINSLKNLIEQPVKGSKDINARAEAIKKLGEEEARLIRVNIHLQQAALQEGADNYAMSLKGQTESLKTELDEQQQLLNLFADAKKAKKIEEEQETEVKNVIGKTKRFEDLIKAFGEEEALDIAHKAAKLERQGEHDKALELLRKKDIEAQKKIRNAGEEERKKIDKQILSDRQGLASNLLTIGRIAGGGLFKITQATSLAIATVDGFTAIQKAATIAPFPKNIPSIIKETARAASTITSIKSASPSFEQGGIVPGSSFSGDNVSANVNSGEMILNRQQQTQLFAQANGGGGGSKEIVVHTKVQIDEETIFKAVSRQVANGGELGEVT